VLIPGLGDDNIQTKTRIEPGLAQQWRSKYQEAALMAETRAMMEEIGIESTTPG
jgi:hypothetical protein